MTSGTSGGWARSTLERLQVVGPEQCALLVVHYGVDVGALSPVPVSPMQSTNSVSA